MSHPPTCHVTHMPPTHLFFPTGREDGGGGHLCRTTVCLFQPPHQLKVESPEVLYIASHKPQQQASRVNTNELRHHHVQLNPVSTFTSYPPSPSPSLSSALALLFPLIMDNCIVLYYCNDVIVIPELSLKSYISFEIFEILCT